MFSDIFLNFIHFSQTYVTPATVGRLEKQALRPGVSSPETPARPCVWAGKRRKAPPLCFGPCLAGADHTIKWRRGIA